MSGLEDLYREIILDHYRSPRNKGQLETPPACKTEGFNPLCGDEVVVYLSVGEDGLVDIAIDGQGCSISLASASMMSAAVKGKTQEEAMQMIRTFKGMMSVHEQDIGGDGSTTAELAVAGEEDDDVDLGDIEALRGVVQYPVRIKCATLGWNTLTQAFEDLEAAAS